MAGYLQNLADRYFSGMLAAHTVLVTVLVAGSMLLLLF